MMTVKERLINAITGKEVDRVPHSPFLAYFWQYLDDEIQNKGQFEYLKMLGADPLIRGHVPLFKLDYDNACTITKSETATKSQVKYITPVGTIYEEKTYVSASNTWFLTRHPVQTEKDIKTLIYLFDHIKVKEDFEKYNILNQKIKEDGLIIPSVGANHKSDFQSLVEHWIGTENLSYLYYDEPELIEEMLYSMGKRSTETIEISAKSDAEGFIFWEDSSTTNISPEMFKTYISPQLSQWSDKLHKSDKFLVHHACGHIKDLIPLMAETQIDCIESISPPPTGNVTIKEAVSMLNGKNVSLIGGVEPTVLLNSSMKDFEVYVRELLECTKNFPYVLSNSDSCPPFVDIEKFKLMSKIVKGEV